MFADQVTVNGSCIHFVWQVSATPIIVYPIAVADTLCERALNFPVPAVNEERDLIGDVAAGAGSLDEKQKQHCTVLHQVVQRN